MQAPRYRIRREGKGAWPGLVFCLALWGICILTASAAETNRVPGVVISHSPQSSGIYIGSPSLAVLPTGDYVASHDEFGPRSTEHNHDANFLTFHRIINFRRLTPTNSVPVAPPST